MNDNRHVKHNSQSRTLNSLSFLYYSVNPKQRTNSIYTAKTNDKTTKISTLASLKIKHKKNQLSSYLNSSISCLFKDSFNKTRVISSDANELDQKKKQRYNINSPNTTRIAFNKCIPSKTQHHFQTPTKHGNHYNKSSEISNDMKKIYKRGVPQRSLNSLKKNQPSANIRIYSILSSKKKLKYYIPKEENESKQKSADEFFHDLYAPIKKYQLKQKTKDIKTILNEVAVEYSIPTSIVNRKSFSHRYRSQELINCSSSYHLRNQTDRQLSQPIDLKVNIRDIINTKPLHCEKDQLLDRYKRVMIKAAIHFKRLRMKLGDFYAHKFDFSKGSHTKETQLFKCALNDKDYPVIISMIKADKFFVMEFDDFKQTPLHWAAKRNVYKVIYFMIRQGASVFCKDAIGRTPLHIAAQSNHLEALQMLLYGLADPFIKDNYGFMAIDLTRSQIIKYILQRTALLHTIRMMGKAKDFEKGIKAGLNYLFYNELRTDFKNLKKYL